MRVSDDQFINSYQSEAVPELSGRYEMAEGAGEGDVWARRRQRTCAINLRRGVGVRRPNLQKRARRQGLSQKRF